METPIAGKDRSLTQGDVLGLQAQAPIGLAFSNLILGFSDLNSGPDAYKLSPSMLSLLLTNCYLPLSLSSHPPHMHGLLFFVFLITLFITYIHS